ncbi:MAG TPA: tail assembly chaperone [Candidatus Limosilactobacillus intestinavium]|nr:tail assembly chaperone [Candidatus Limosilactobacillus intestinavium]
MELQINDKTYELNFGVRFVRELDKVAGMTVNGQPFGFGLTKSLPALQAYDPAVLSDVIYCATYGSRPRLTQHAIDDYIDQCDDLEKVFDQVNSEIADANAVKVAAKNMKP